MDILSHYRCFLPAIRSPLVLRFHELDVVASKYFDLFFPSGMLRNFTDYAMMLVFPSGMLRNFTNYAMMPVLKVPKGANKVHGPTASTPGRNLGMTGGKLA